MKRIVSVFMLLFLVICTGREALAADVADQSWKSFETECFQLRKFEYELQKASDTQRQKLAAGYAQQMDDGSFVPGAPGEHFFKYYKARLLAVAHSYDAANRLLIPLTAEETIAPEAVSELRMISVTTTSNTIDEGKYNLYLAELLPVSYYASNRDFRETHRVGFVEDEAVIPLFQIPDLMRIGHLYEQMQMYQQAADAFREYIYYEFAPALALYVDEQQNSWLSALAAPYWLQVAENERLAGHPSQAWDYIAKSLVFGIDENKFNVLKTIVKWTQGPPPTPAQAAIVLDPREIEQIAAWYVHLNAHPRALELLKEYHGLLGKDGETLRSSYAQKWLALVEDACRMVEGKCVVYGQDVMPKEHRLDVTIPPLTNPAALQFVSHDIKKLYGMSSTPEK